MTGTIRKRVSPKKNVSYQLIIDKGLDAKGKRIREYFTYESKKSAEIAKSEKLDQLNKGIYIQPSQRTVQDICEEWLQTYAIPNLAVSTVRGYKVNLYNHAFPYIGNISVQKLTPLQIQDMYRMLQEKGLGARSIKYVHTTLREALQYAFRMGIVPRNMADFVSTPKQEKFQSEVYNEDEALELLECAKGSDMEVPITIAVALGLRRGEILALKWSDINFKENTVSIQRNLVCIKGEVIFTTPKTKAGIREISMPDYLVTVLKEHRLNQAKQRFSIGNMYQNSDLVCCREDGTPYNTSSFSLKFKRFLEKNNLKHIRLHDLRHTCATLMLKYGVSAKTASIRLGHSNVGITLDIYTHVLKEVEREVSDKLDSNLFDKLKLG